MLSKQLEVGDTIIIRGVVSYVDSQMFRFYQEDINEGCQSALWPTVRITEIIPKPWEPRIGEEVDLAGRISVTQHGFTLLNIHGDGTPFHDGNIRKWATVAFLGDRPEVVLYSNIRQRVKNEQAA